MLFHADNLCHTVTVEKLTSSKLTPDTNGNAVLENANILRGKHSSPAPLSLMNISTAAAVPIKRFEDLGSGNIMHIETATKLYKHVFLVIFVATELYI